MKKILTLSAALMLFASLAMAQGVGLYIGADCNAAASQSVTNTCLTNSGTAIATFGTCIVPAVTKSAFVGEISIIDVQTTLAQIPDWWRADACRGTGFSLTTDGSIGGTTCAATMWDTAAPAGNNITGLNGTSGVPANRERLNLGAVLLPTAVYDYVGDGTTEIAVFKFSVLKAKSVGAGSCGGCAQGACIVLNEIQMQGQNDQTEADYVRMTTPIAGHNYIAYNSGAPAPCPGVTPTLNRTWGQVKALYR
jgi:hypothetical protein